MSSMREQAGQGALVESQSTDAFVVFDALAYAVLFEPVQFYLKAENLLDEEYVVARRPFGARPGRPRFVQLGVKAEM
jgi:Fe(3+) dicitrate transport protein